MAMDSTPSLRPREHGATAQLLVALAATLLAGPARLPALALALACLAAFLAVEPALVLAGFRGQSTRERLAGPALRRLGLMAPLALALAVVAVLKAPATLWALAVPLVPTLLLGLGFALRGVYGPLSEGLAALAFAGLAFPLRRAAGVPLPETLGFTGALAAIFLQATLTVRILMGCRGAAHPWLRRLFIPLTALGGMALFHDLATTGSLAPAAPVAFLPASLAGLALLMAPPSRLRALGWILAASTGSGALILALATR